MNRQVKASGILLVTVFLSGACLSRGSWEAGGGNTAASVSRGAMLPGNPPVGGFPNSIGGAIDTAIFVSDDLVQSVSYTPDEKSITFFSSQRAPDDAFPYDVTTAVFSTAFEVKKVIHGGQSHLFYVNGRARNGDDVIEKWEISIQEDAIYARRPMATSSVGTPYTSQGLAQGILSGSFVYAGNRSEVLTADRIELYRGAGLGTVLGVAADPDGRFVLFLAGGSLYRLEVGPTLAVPEVIMTTADFQDLPRSTEVDIRDLLLTGERVAIVTALGLDNGPLRRAVLPDPDNDGSFDLPPLVFDEDVYYQAGLLNQDAWNDYVLFW